MPLLDIPLDGSTPLDTPYATTDISWEYDAASDFPTYPLNLLAVANAVLAGSFVHGNYFAADLTGPRAFPDTTVGNITYITLKTPHLPLLMPLYEIGFPTALLDLVEPALTVMVDWGYDRSAGPGTPATAGLLPRLDPSPRPPTWSTRSVRECTTSSPTSHRPRCAASQRRRDPGAAASAAGATKLTVTAPKPPS